MTSHHSDILLPRAAWGSESSPSRIIAFVPITIALAGVIAILAGGVTMQSVRLHEPAVAVSTHPTTTGTIAGDALPMLDR